MAVGRRVRATLRGPVRTRVRVWQDEHELPLDKRQAGPPDFVGIGVQRSGTSWWHSLIEQHPQVATLGWGAKELHFFDDRWREDPADPTGERMAQAYAAHFRRRPDQIAGEWTPRYLLDPWAVPALLRAAPDARLLVMLRDPVARFVSGIQHQAKLGTTGPDAITAAYDRGRYAAQLAPVLDLVARDRILVLQLEACQRDPEPWLDRTFEFLGLPAHRPGTAGHRNQSSARVEISPALLDSVRAGYRHDLAHLAELLPDLDLGLWPTAAG